MTGFVAVLTALLAALVAACGVMSTPETTISVPVAPPVDLRLEFFLPGAGGLLGAPTNLVQAPDGSLLITEQGGRIWTLNYEVLPDEHRFIPGPPDLRDRVSSRGWEEGLLGLAVSPANERHVFLYYSASNPRRSVVSRFTFSRGYDFLDVGSELVVLEVAQPYANHNGGQLAFGPDGYLYIGLGDGGSAGDPQGNGQDTSTLLGAILRIDVSEATVAQPYAIPPDNPFAAGGGRPEIWAYGLRNPWRFSFDRGTGELWVGDVGQNRWEEIDVIEPGGNYGWDVMEGNHCFEPSSGCQEGGLIPPVWEYTLEGDACSVIGGYVYRGSAIPSLTGWYIYGDFCTGEIFGLRRDGSDVINLLLADTDNRIASFGEDNDGELYVLMQGEGVYRLTSNP